MYYYVMKHKNTDELNIISHKNYREYATLDSDLVYDYIIIYASTDYDECLKYCEEKIGYKE